MVVQPRCRRDLNSLDGVLVPTWGAYDLAATLLFPFVAIRMISSEKESGALKLLLQLPGTLLSKLAAKGVVLLCAWLVRVAAGPRGDFALAILRRPCLRAGDVELVAGPSAAWFVEWRAWRRGRGADGGAASAAIVTLAFTVGTWALDFIAAGRGGFVQQLASYTPTAALRSFEQGLAAAQRGAGDRVAQLRCVWSGGDLVEYGPRVQVPARGERWCC